MTPDDDHGQLTRLIGVYDADGTALGELSYWVRARLGRAHCDLCDITHSLFRQRAEWKACRATLPIPFDTFHRDDQPASVREVTGGQVPVVAAETDGGCVLLLGPAEIAACHGSVDQLMAAAERAAADRHVSWTER